MDHDFIMLNKEKNNYLVGCIVLNDKEFLDRLQKLAWSSQIAENRIVSKLGQGKKISTLILKGFGSSSGIVQEFFYLLPRFIQHCGLSEFVLEGVKPSALHKPGSKIEVDSGAIGHILEQTNELR